jgi:hypothetical protein
VSALSAAPWVVDPTRLRVTLDALRQAFSEEHVVIPPETFLIDRARVLDSVRLVLDNLRQFTGRGIVPGVVEEYRPREQADSLTRLLLDLQQGWERRVAVKLGSRKLESLRRLLGRSVPDFLHLLGRERDENTNSSVLAWLLDPRHAPTLALPALCALAEFLDDTTTWARREIVSKSFFEAEACSRRPRDQAVEIEQESVEVERSMVMARGLTSLRPFRRRPIQGDAVPARQIGGRVVNALKEVEHCLIRRW